MPVLAGMPLAAYGLEVVRYDLGLTGDDLVHEVQVTIEVRDQHLDSDLGRRALDRLDGLHPVLRSVVRQVVAVYAGDDGVA